MQRELQMDQVLHLGAVALDDAKPDQKQDRPLASHLARCETQDVRREPPRHVVRGAARVGGVSRIRGRVRRTRDGHPARVPLPGPCLVPSTHPQHGKPNVRVPRK